MAELNLTAPKAWKELSAGQLTYMSWLLTARSLSEADLRAHAFVRLTGISVLSRTADSWECSKGEQRFTLTTEEVNCFCRSFAWLTDSVTEVTPLPTLAKQKHIDVRLRNAPLVQYLAAENYYQAFIFTQQEAFLNRLCACFYTNGKKFNDGQTESRAAQFEAMPFHERYTVFLWYFGLKSVLAKAFPFFFKKVDEAETDKEATAPDMRKIMNNMVRALTGGDVTKLKAVYATDTWTALAELDAKAREYAEYDKRMKNLKK